MFAIVGDVLTLVLASPSGLTKTGNKLAADAYSTGGLQINTNGLSIKTLSTGGLETDASGTGIKLDEDSLTLSASGLKVNADLIDWPDLTANRMVATNASETLVTIADLTAWIAGTVNQIDIADDGDGSATLSLPQDLDVTALEGLMYYSGGH